MKWYLSQAAADQAMYLSDLAGKYDVSWLLLVLESGLLFKVMKIVLNVKLDDP